MDASKEQVAFGVRFSRSIIAEYLVYALLFYSTTAVIALFIFLPIDCLGALLRRDSSRLNLVDFQNDAFILPINNFTFTTFSLPTKILLVVLWALTARPAVALASRLNWVFPSHPADPDLHR
ncbi:hypothetical protein CGLO_02861 [Colletotrichum gloeosporioides Cg-14]|uniref:Uncharacterized protein n=1 Tax=Colletotrichum gloeosporioides (strain Cg-14) TaxID=1237896 RepID=T0M7X7_COLGC|nr:hypothetical protein CGLO_02861 [Colletotrichum gloeosporioides Cg-14]